MINSATPAKGGSASGGKKVEIYSAESCHFCHMAKEFFATHNIPFTDYNVCTDTTKRKEMIEKSGQMGVPVIVIDNKDIIIGFDENSLTKLFDLSA